MVDDPSPEKDESPKTKGVPEWTETCIGVWIKASKDQGGKIEEERRICRGISVLHLNKFASLNKVKSIPTQGIEIVISEAANDKPSKPHNIHPFLGIFVDEQESTKQETATVDGAENRLQTKSDENKLPDSDEATPKILHKVAENWAKRAVTVGEKVKKYYHDPRSSTEMIDDLQQTFSNGYETTARIISYCQPRQKLRQVCNFISERAKSFSKWWSE